MTPQIDGRTGLEVLERDECLHLLEHGHLGRLAVVVDGHPLVFPVNYALDGDAIVLRTDTGTKLYGARRGSVAFECDGTDGTYHTGWSVLATGTAEEVDDAADIARLDRLPVGAWCPGPMATWLRIRPRSLTGRRIPPHGHERSAASPTA
jgi:hypothetical protein